MNKELSRRDFLAITGGVLATAATASAYQSPMKLYVYAGSTTQGPFGAGGGGGVRILTINPNDGSLTLVGQTGSEMDDLNADGICISPNGRFLYSVDEKRNLHGKNGTGGGVVAFAINRENGSLTHLNTQPSVGANPAYVAVNADGTRVLAANHGQGGLSAIRVVKKNGVAEIEDIYDDGTVSLFVVKADGSLEPACDVSVLERKPGTAANSQPVGQAHSVNFDPSSRFALACDVGTDHLYVYQLDAGSRSLAKVKVFPTIPGRAPRFSAFHPRLPYVFVVNEREPSLSCFHFDSRTGDVREVQTIATIPDGYTGPRVSPSDIHIHPNGKFVYGSNRGDDSIVIVKIDEATGMMGRVDIVKTQGSNPRGFSFDPSGKFLVVGNQASNMVVTFAVDADTGKMTPTGSRIEVPRPASVRCVAL